MANISFYLIPSSLSENEPKDQIPESTKNIVKNTTCYFVEELRTARRYISSLKLGLVIENLHFWVVDKKTEYKQIDLFVAEAKKLGATQIGIISEAGCPGIADPGAIIAEYGHKHNMPVIPCVGPSSILMALMASGMNGQSFRFSGYLPIKKQERIAAMKELEAIAYRKKESQIFMETPFRNASILDDLVEHLSPNSRLCIAQNITATDQSVMTKTIKEWKNNKPDISKIPVIFIIG